MLIFKDVLEDLDDLHMSLELYRDEYDDDHFIGIDDAEFNEVDFQDIIKIIPLRGNEKSPAPSIAIIINSSEGLDPETVMTGAPRVASLMDYFKRIDPAAKRKVVGAFSEESMVLKFGIRNNYPEIPVFRFEVADIVVCIPNT